MRFATLLCALVALMFYTSIVVGSSERTEYTLDTGDVLDLSVFREDNFKRRITVDVDGDVAIPLVGFVNARGLTLSQLREKARSLLVAKGIFVAPDVSLVVVELRPFYIEGDIVKPGPHPFTAELTVRRAIALAGGYNLMRMRTEDPNMTSADLRAQYENLWLDYVRSKAKILSLRAQIDNQTHLDLAPLANSPVPSSFIEETNKLEQARFEGSLTLLHMEKEHLRRSVEFEEAEIKTLSEGVNEDVAGSNAAAQTIARVKDLNTRGITPITRLDEEQRLFFQQKSRQSDIEARLAQARTKLETSKAKSVRFDEDRHMLLIKELQDATLEMEKIEAQQQGVAQKLLIVGAITSQMTNGDHVEPEVTIYRQIDGSTSKILAKENSMIRPGDIIDILFSQRQLMMVGGRL